MEYLVYASGPIIGCTYDEANGWREGLQTKLPPHIKVISPLRGKDQLKGTDKHFNSEKYDFEPDPVAARKMIVCRDRFDTKRAHVLLVNLLNAKKVSIGTCFEMAWANIMDIPIILIMEKAGNVHEHPFVREVPGYIVPTLDEAAEILKIMLTP